MDQRLLELFWLRAEGWITACGHAQHGRGRVLCPMCGILPVSATFMIHGRALVLCLECAGEVQGTRRRVSE